MRGNFDNDGWRLQFEEVDGAVRLALGVHDLGEMEMDGDGIVVLTKDMDVDHRASLAAELEIAYGFDPGGGAFLIKPAIQGMSPQLVLWMTEELFSEVVYFKDAACLVHENNGQRRFLEQGTELGLRGAKLLFMAHFFRGILNADKQSAPGQAGRLKFQIRRRWRG